jgi:ABC-type dipeptide/oligopeptide/nickel transport system ATPase subunit
MFIDGRLGKLIGLLGEAGAGKHEAASFSVGAARRRSTQGNYDPQC